MGKASFVTRLFNYRVNSSCNRRGHGDDAWLLARYVGARRLGLKFSHPLHRGRLGKWKSKIRLKGRCHYTRTCSWTWASPLLRLR
ncbi:hypothetical protein BC827DRAFT_460443 [Russula dissimulans]|nr:hypothetical protein BC827DRAFT_460443 [Russula dissimulans]